MNDRTPPRTATWFLKQFGSRMENETVLGDLVEQYGRGRSAAWYWRQVFVIVLIGVGREVRHDKWRFLAAMAACWFTWLVVQATAGFLLAVRTALAAGERIGMTVNLFPLVTVRVATEQHTEEWDVGLLTILLNAVTLVVIGKLLTASPRLRAQTLVLLYTSTYIAGIAVTTCLEIVRVYQGAPNALGFLVINLLALPAVPIFLFLGAAFFRGSAHEVLSRE